VNVGYDKHQVENSELAKQEEELENRLKRMASYIPACEVRLTRAWQQYRKHAAHYRAEWEAAQQALAQLSPPQARLLICWLAGIENTGDNHSELFKNGTSHTQDERSGKKPIGGHDQPDHSIAAGPVDGCPARLVEPLVVPIHWRHRDGF